MSAVPIAGNFGERRRRDDEADVELRDRRKHTRQQGTPAERGRELFKVSQGRLPSVRDAGGESRRDQAEEAGTVETDSPGEDGREGEEHVTRESAAGGDQSQLELRSGGRENRRQPHRQHEGSAGPEEETCVKKEEMVQTMNNAKKNRSDLQLPSIHRPRLTYYQRYQKESGFDPQSISLKGLEEVKDTARSVYGDSAREAISDVSGRFAILEEDESEEAFYHRVITKGRNILHSAKPTLEKTNMVRTHEDHIRERIRERIQRAKEINMERKNVSLVSDLKASPIGCLITNRSGRKIHALCGKNPEPIPKAELVSRARAYGNQANTRNIVKLQMKSRLRQEGICGPGVKKCFKMEQRKSHLFLPPLEEKLSRNWDMKNNEKSVLDREMFRRNLSNMRMHIAGLRNALDRGEKG
ncbi:UNVERIFIED_CONTAM: hypothetical protein PYX00_005876 [Menopon gallinae]|uniref:Uncharacterized protein n=1 Tax=Menopon gallinae TaxID=328185 RepID=A0AAW2HSX1_9NEOP